MSPGTPEWIHSCIFGRKEEGGLAEREVSCHDTRAQTARMYSLSSTLTMPSDPGPLSSWAMIHISDLVKLSKTTSGKYPA